MGEKLEKGGVEEKERGAGNGVSKETAFFSRAANVNKIKLSSPGRNIKTEIELMHNLAGHFRARRRQAMLEGDQELLPLQKTLINIQLDLASRRHQAFLQVGTTNQDSEDTTRYRTRSRLEFPSGVAIAAGLPGQPECGHPCPLRERDPWGPIRDKVFPQVKIALGSKLLPVADDGSICCELPLREHDIRGSPRDEEAIS
ncbi:hypothetical protein EGW08_001637 [Elysia chlorotica]|uniref:Uncharacterized protein n=1 Tax=Elysia chlorotica TaxID=188477 RepID=A0A3S1BWR2_ELYCH|nr:hypothetical protein EGW08_001637 [Elysia chlorotica]